MRIRCAGHFSAAALWAATFAAGPLPAAATPAAGDPLADALVARGFENVRTGVAAGTVTVWFENRVIRDDLRALGDAARIALPHAGTATRLELVPLNYDIPLLALSADVDDWRAFLERRASAAWFRSRITLLPADAAPRVRRPPGERRNSSVGRTDVRVRPLFAFELGIVDDPFRSSLRVAPEAVVSPFPGSIATVQLDIAVAENLDPASRDVAPGRNTLSCAGWLPGGWLGTVSGGIFPGDRYGFAGEIGRVTAGGLLEGRLGGDIVGLLEFDRSATFYSDLDLWSAFAAVTCRTAEPDLEATLTAGRFHEDRLGVRADLDRRFGEHEFGFFLARSGGNSVLGMQFRIPLPVAAWSRPAPVRLSTVPAFPFEYRDALTGVARRASLFDNLDRLRKRLYPTHIRSRIGGLRGDPTPGAARRAEEPVPRGAMNGMSGLVNTPTADVLPEGALRAGGAWTPREWAQPGRDRMRNEAYFLSLGFLPGLEVSLRATVLPEISLIPGEDAPVMDRLASARLRLRGEGAFVPALAVGMDDVRGTRLYHAFYAVATKTVAETPVPVRITAGYGSDALEAAFHVLDGAFGGVDARLGCRVVARLDFDSEKWNSGLSLALPGGLNAQLVLLHLDTVTGGLAWNHMF